MIADGAAQPVPPQRGDDVQVEIVDTAGRPITERPIGIEELLQNADHTINVRDGIALRLEALNAQQDYSEDDADGAGSAGDDASSHESASEGRSSEPPLPTAPPGTRATNDWYDVLDALRREQVDVERTTAEVEATLKQSADGEGRLVTRNPNDLRRIAATPLKRFSNAPSTTGKSIAVDSGASSRAVPPAPGASRREVWASLAPSKDTQPPHDYKTLRYTSFMEALDCHRFRPSALTFHAAASYLNRKDRGQRLLVYGGIGPGARSVEQELYEFSVLTGNWRRVEGRQLVPAGHYGHTIAVVEALDRLVVVGGIGPGGAPVSAETALAWTTDPQRAPRYQCLCPLLQPRSTRPVAGTAAEAAAGAVSAVVPASAPPSAMPPPPSSSAASPAAAPIGFVSLLFDMSLSEQTWRAIQPAVPFPLAFHTGVHFGKEIFVFGGLTDDLRVSGQLLAVNPATYTVRLIQTESGPARPGNHNPQAAGTGDGEPGDAAGPGPRFLHTAVRYGPYMIVYGGYNAHNEVCGDCWAFDMTNERWERLRCQGDPAGRAGHECCVVGCRMLVTGGFECSLEETRSGAAPAAAVMELNLVPTVKGEHVWRAEVRLRPALPPLAFARCAPCGDDNSFLLFGGLTKPPKRLAGRSHSAGGRSASVKRRATSAAAHHGSDSDASEPSDGDDDDGDGASRKRTASKHAADASGASSRQRGLLRRLAPFNDGLVFTFPVKQQHAKRAESAPVVNELGVEIDPDELPEHFKAFVRRQEDFVKKKDAAAADVMRKTTLEEQEGMEPTLYLTEDEIELLLHRSEECCVAFAERYKMDTLPSNVPDRETRVRLIEECVSESRQVRDVIRSMKGSAPGVTAVKSKTHRKRAGQKFEDYSAAKPFRRVVVAHLLDSINHHLAQMHRLNKALRTVDWEEKGAFMEAVDDMQNSVHAVSRAISGVLNKYIQNRVESLMKGVDRHKEVMRQLTQVVEKNRHDKIWGVEAARDEKRHEQQRSRAAGGGAGAKSEAAATDTAASPTPAAASRARSARSRVIGGGGYHADESKAVVHLMDKEWTDLLGRVRLAERSAEQLRRYCEEGATTAAVAGAPLPPPLPPAVVGGSPLALPTTAAAALTLPVPGQPPALIAPPQGLAVPQVVGVVPPPAIQQPPTLPTPPVVEGAGAAVAGSARPQDIIVQHSNELRRTTAAAAERVQQAAADFYTALSEGTGDGAAGAAAAPAHSSTTLSFSRSQRGSGASNHTPAAPAATVISEQSGGTVTRRSRSSASSSSSSSSSSSTSATAAVHAPAAIHAPAALVAVPPQLPLPPALAGGAAAPPPPPVTAMLGPSSSPKPDAAAPPKRDPASTAAAAAEAPLQVPSGHALRLGSLRPLLAAKDALARLQDKVPLIRLNEWDGNDLAGAPQDARAEELYKRLVKLVMAVAQCVKASFLSKAGARPPRVRPPTLSVGPPPAAQAAKKGTTTTTSAAAARGASAAKRLSQPRSLLSGGTASSEPGASLREQRPLGSPGRLSVSAQLSGEGRGNARRAAKGAEAGTADSLRLKPLSAPDGHGSAADAVHDWWTITSATRAAGEAARTATAAPLVPHEALLRDIRQCTPAPAAASADGAEKPSVAEVCAVYPGVKTVPNTSVRDAARVTGAALIGAAGPWAPMLASSSLAGGVGRAASATAAASTALALSVVPKVVMPAVSRDQDGDDTAATSVLQPTPMARRRSTIAELSQVQHPTHHQPRASSSAGQGSLGTESSEPVTREPVTSITGGNFVVNAEYLSRVAPDALPAAATAEEKMEGGIGGVQHAWADVDDDYFYFGRPVERRATPAAATVSGPPYVMTRASPAGVSAPVGTVLSSPRMNAELTVPPMRGAPAASPLTAPRLRTSSSGAAHRNDSSSSSSRPTEHYLSTTASQAHKSQTARPLVRKEGARHSFYTPGELQLMQAREKLRPRPSK